MCSFIFCTIVSYSDKCNGTDIRLVGGGTQNEGKVEMCFNGLWNTVCLNYNDYKDARMVCRQLQYDGCGYIIIIKPHVIIFLCYSISSSVMYHYTPMVYFVMEMITL